MADPSKSGADPARTIQDELERLRRRAGAVPADPDTRDVVHNIYVRKVERVNGELYNAEVATFESVKDPLKPPKRGN